MAVQIVEIAGQKIAMLPMEDYQRLIDIAEDKADIQAAVEAERRATKGEEYIPVAILDSILAGESSLRAWRKYRGMTQKQLAERLSITPVYVSDLELGNCKGPMSIWRKLASALDVSLEEIAPDD